MPRRRRATTVQVNIRLDVTVVDELEAHARLNRNSFSEEARRRLIDSLNPPSLADSLANFKNLVRDVVEQHIRQEDPENIEKGWQRLRALDAACAQFYTAVENELSAYAHSSAVRQLMRGAPQALPGETKARG
jgi:hypothetical protein